MRTNRWVFPANSIICITVNPNIRVFTQAYVTVDLVHACATVKTAGLLAVVDVCFTESTAETWFTKAFKIVDEILAALGPAQITWIGATLIDFDNAIGRGPARLAITRIIFPTTEAIHAVADCVVRVAWIRVAVINVVTTKTVTRETKFA